MKIQSILLFGILSSARAFTIPQQQQTITSRYETTTSQLYMFGGGGAAAPKEDDPEEMAKMEEAAKAMGMSVKEYQLGVSARMKLTEELNAARVTGGNSDKVSVIRDGNNPPKLLEINVTEAGKALGKEALSKELCAALKSASDASRVSRTEAQKKMMAFIGEEMKKL